MRYIEDFLGLGTVIFNSLVPKGTIYGTAKENLILYYVPVNGADLDNAFEFVSDNTGYIGIHEVPDYSNMTSSDTVICGMVLFAERLDGVVKGTIGSAVVPGITLNNTTLTVAPSDTATLTATTVPAGETVTWTSSDDTKATVANGVVTGVAEGSATITATITVDGTNYTATCAVTVSTGA